MGKRSSPSSILNADETVSFFSMNLRPPFPPSVNLHFSFYSMKSYVRFMMLNSSSLRILHCSSAFLKRKSFPLTTIAYEELLTKTRIHSKSIEDL